MVICRGDEFLQYLGYKKDSSNKNYLNFENKILNINQQNRYGESLIFVAAYFCEFEMVIHLLSIGADPNIANHEGNTALHAAAYFDNLRLLQILVESGGDLRLVNNDGLRPCQMMKNTKNSEKIKDFEQNLFKNFKLHLSIPNNPISLPHRKNSILNNLQKINRNNQHKIVSPYFTFQSGFGNYFCLNKTIKGLISSIKIIVNSKDLTTDLKSKIPNFPCGLYTKVISKNWHSTPVSVKIISLLDGKENVSDRRTNILTNQFIKEANILGSLRHPNVLLLMGVNLVLDDKLFTMQYQTIFERCDNGSMHNYLHNQNQQFNNCNRIEILNNVIDALVFIHSQGIVHGSICSHCVYLVNENSGKLGNFENSMEISFDDKKSQLRSQQWNSYNFYNNLDNTFKWLAPEILKDKFVVCPSIDIYSLAIVIWESYTGLIPHQNKTYRNLIQRYTTPFSGELSFRIPENLLKLLQQSIKQDPSQRPKLCDIQYEISNLKKSINESFHLESDKESTRALSEILLKKEKIDDFQPPIEVHVETTDDDTYASISSNRTSVKKSNSFNCSRENKTSQTTGSQFLKHVTDSAWRKKLEYRDLAALPNFQNSEINWKYPSTQTEIVIEGQGNLSNSTHKVSITRGMKPASHQISLSASQTNICTILGTNDLIKSSSRGSLHNNSSSHSLNKSSNERKVTNKPNPFSSYKQFNCGTFTNVKHSRPNIKSNIASLIEKYENSELHPYSGGASNNSTPIAAVSRNLSNYNSPSKVIFNSSNSSADSPKSSAASPSSASTTTYGKKSSYFPSFIKRETSKWSSTTEDEENNKFNRNFNTKSRHQKQKLFGDITNNLC